MKPEGYTPYNTDKVWEEGVLWPHHGIDAEDPDAWKHFYQATRERYDERHTGDDYPTNLPLQMSDVISILAAATGKWAVFAHFSIDDWWTDEHYAKRNAAENTEEMARIGRENMEDLFSKIGGFDPQMDKVPVYGGIHEMPGHSILHGQFVALFDTEEEAHACLRACDDSEGKVYATLHSRLGLLVSENT